MQSRFLRSVKYVAPSIKQEKNYPPVRSAVSDKVLFSSQHPLTGFNNRLQHNKLILSLMQELSTKNTEKVNEH